MAANEPAGRFTFFLLMLSDPHLEHFLTSFSLMANFHHGIVILRLSYKKSAEEEDRISIQPTNDGRRITDNGRDG